MTNQVRWLGAIQPGASPFSTPFIPPVVPTTLPLPPINSGTQEVAPKPSLPGQEFGYYTPSPPADETATTPPPAAKKSSNAVLWVVGIGLVAAVGFVATRNA